LKEYLWMLTRPRRTSAHLILYRWKSLKIFSVFNFRLGTMCPATIQERLQTESNLEDLYSMDLMFSSDTSTYKFTGKPVSQTTGLYYEYARWYDPTTGRFISPDPKKGHLSDPQTLNQYVYVVDQPTGITDPSGMDGCWVFSWVCNQVSSGATTLYNGAVTAGNDVVNEWNNDPNFRAAVILTVATVAIVATAGLVAPALLPTIAVGIGLGASISTGAYVGTTLASGGKITASGLSLAASTGAFLGAVGAVAGPLGGSVAKSFDLGATSALARGVTGSLLFGASVDANLANGQRDPRVLLAEGGLSLITAGGSSELLGEAGLGTRGMTTLEQSEIFAPGIAAFGRLSSNASGVLANGAVGGGLGAAADWAFKAYLQPLL
jgi:RHS repeat-associated protein